MFEAPEINWYVLLPFIIVAGWGMLLMVIDLFVSDERKKWATNLTIAGLLFALVVTVLQWNNGGVTFVADGRPMVVLDNFAIFLNGTLLLAALLAIMISSNFLRDNGLERPEYYILLLFSLSGMMLMGMANDLILIFLALELLSIPLYIMSGFAWPRLDSEESAMKYFLLGAFSSAIFVFGIALTYGATGTTSLPLIVERVALDSVFGLAAVAFILVGLAFKVAAAPFHMWTPDVYEGAPTATTAFMSVGAKVAGFAALLRIFLIAFPNMGDGWIGAMAILATLTLIVGNVVAIMQHNIKRMLAYSSIAHAGYILIALASSLNSKDGVSAVLFYLFAYLFSNLGAFAIVIALERKQGEGVLLEDYKGMVKRSPGWALAMTLWIDQDSFLVRGWVVAPADADADEDEEALLQCEYESIELDAPIRAERFAIGPERSRLVAQHLGGHHGNADNDALGEKSASSAFSASLARSVPSGLSLGGSPGKRLA
jgi:NADH-quinone oxidoreductase subunit N